MKRGTPYRVSNEAHLKNEWLVQKLAPDFELLDVWEYPICFKTNEDDTLYRFRKHAIEPTLKNAFNFSITGALFYFRGVVGRVFRLDENVNKLPIPDCKEISLAERMDKTEKSQHSSNRNIDIRTEIFFDFRTVYSLENETVNEISNATEHTLMHYAWMKSENNCYKVQMASYVKHRNRMGSFYIKLISPFRHWIVYPYLFNEYIRRWEKYKTTSTQEVGEPYNPALN